MKLCTIFSAVVAASSFVAAAPARREENADNTDMFLRVYAPNTRFHELMVVRAPSGQLALRNATEHPELLPAFFHKVLFGSEQDASAPYGFQFTDGGDLLTVVQPKESTPLTQDATLGSVAAVTGSDFSKGVPVLQCPAGQDCTPNKYVVANAPRDGTAEDQAIVGRLQYLGFKGQWQPKTDNGDDLLHFVGEARGGNDATTSQHFRLDIMPRTINLANLADGSAAPRGCTTYRFICICPSNLRGKIC